MPGKPGHRRFGSIRRRESGRWQVRYLGTDGVSHTAPETFARRSDADRFLTLLEAQLAKGEWIDPERGKVTVKDYAEQWIAQRPGLRPRTVDLYTWLLGKHVTPYLGPVPLGKLDTAAVRQWRARLLTDGVSVGMAAKAYRLLRAVLMTAVKEDEILRVNPCRIPGADQERAAERPTLTLGQVFALADRMPERYRALVLLATFASLRWGEVSALHRGDFDCRAGTVRVRQAFVEQRGVGLVLGPPKSRAGRRVVAVPATIVPAVSDHLAAFTGPGADALMFTVPSGRPIWRGNFNTLVKWRESVAAIGAAGVHFHDLRHTGNTLASQAKPSLRDLMTRMGHDSPRAALIYQHASADADHAIADAVDLMVQKNQQPD